MKALKNRIKKLEQVNKEKQCIFISNYNDLIKLQHNEIILYFKNEKELYVGLKRGDKNGKMTVKKQNFIIALITEPTQKDAIKKVGISENTAYKWLKDPIFKGKITDIRKEILKTTTTKIQNNITNAIDTLVEVMSDNKQLANARVQSAKAIIEYGFRSMEIEDIAERLEKLEKEEYNKWKD